MRPPQGLWIGLFSPRGGQQALPMTVSTYACTVKIKMPVSLLLGFVPCLSTLSSHGLWGSTHNPLPSQETFPIWFHPCSTLRSYSPSESSSSLIQSQCLWPIQPLETQSSAKWSVDTFSPFPVSLVVMGVGRDGLEVWYIL